MSLINREPEDFDPAWVAKVNNINRELLARRSAEEIALKVVPEGTFFSETAVESIQKSKLLPQEHRMKISLN